MNINISWMEYIQATKIPLSGISLPGIDELLTAAVKEYKVTKNSYNSGGKKLPKDASIEIACIHAEAGWKLVIYSKSWEYKRYSKQYEPTRLILTFHTYSGGDAEEASTVINEMVHRWLHRF